jgi:predicted transcriptional regulator
MSPLVLSLPVAVKEQLSRLAREQERSEAELAGEVVSAFVEDVVLRDAVQEGLRALDEGRSMPLAEFKAGFMRARAARRSGG